MYSEETYVPYTVKLAVAVLSAASSQTNTNPDSALSSGPYTNRVPVGVATAPWSFPVFAIGVPPANKWKMGRGPPSKLQVTFKLSPSMPTRLEGTTWTAIVCDEAPQIRREKVIRHASIVSLFSL